MTLCVEKADAARLMTEGCDDRIVLEPETGLNRYYSAPYPRELIAYASSTANDISAAALRARGAVLAETGAAPDAGVYRERLEGMRARIRAAYGVGDGRGGRLRALGHRSRICRAGAGRGTRAGRDQRDPARRGRGRHAAASIRRTAAISPTRPRSARAVTPGAPVPGLGDATLDLIDIPVRDRMGRVTAVDLYRRADGRLDRRRPRRRPAQPRPYRPRLEDRADPALARRRRRPVRAPWRCRDPGRRRLPGADHQRRGRRLSRARRDRLRHRLQVHGRPAVQRLRPGPRGAGAARAAASRRARHHLPPRRMAGGLARRRGVARQRQYRPAAAARSLACSSSSASRRWTTRRSGG